MQICQKYNLHVIMKYQIQTCPLESWSSNDHLVEKSKYVKQKVHTTTADQDQIQVSGRANRRTKKVRVFRKCQSICFY